MYSKIDGELFENKSKKGFWPPVNYDLYGFRYFVFWTFDFLPILIGVVEHSEYGGSSLYLLLSISPSDE